MLGRTNNLAAIFLGVFYTLVAVFGHALHTNCHASHDSVATAHSCCQGCCHQQVPVIASQSTEVELAIAKSDSDHLTHSECVACHLLSQMSHGFKLDTAHAGFWLNTSFPPVLNEQVVDSYCVTLFDARGPPSLV